MMTVPGPVGLFFYVAMVLEWNAVVGSDDSTLTAKDLAGIRESSFRAAGALVLMCALVVGASAAESTTTSSAKTHRKATTQLSTSSSAKKKSTSSAKGQRSSSRKKKTARTRGQQKIDSERAQSIQEALIREHYLDGEATGTWNQASEDAMRRYQSDHGWQSKTVPDARALIKLGLGPSHDHLLNPESAMTTGPDMPKAASLTPVSRSADPGAGKPSSANPVPASTAAHDSSSPQ
jgi:putative peptidoglycan binding protein